MKWCEKHNVYYLLGLAKNQRLVKKLGKELAQAKQIWFVLRICAVKYCKSMC
jgi:hypothetical protein